MAITPINITRTSFNMTTLSMLDSLRDNTLNLFLQQNRLASGNRINAPSEDPVLGSKATSITELLERQEQILENARFGDKFLAATDTAINEVSGLLIDMHDVASEMVNSTASQDQRDAMAELVVSTLDQLVNIGNRAYNGMYLFGGHKTTSAPFVQDYGGVTYTGDRNDITTDIGEFEEQAINLTGDQLFGALRDQVDGWQDLNPAISDNTRISDLKGTTGDGVNKKGMIRVTLDNPATTFNVDLSKADTIGDVVDMINQAATDAGLTVGAGNDFVTQIHAADPTRLEMAVGAGNVTVTDVGASVTARDLGLRGTAAGVLVGDDIDPSLKPMTPLTDLFAGGGAVLGSIRIQLGSETIDLDLSGASTVQDVVNLITATSPAVQAEINDAGNGINVLNLQSGTDMSIGELGGGNTAELLGIRTYHSDTLLSDLNDGLGVEFREGLADLTIFSKDGSSCDVNLDGCESVQDVIDAINAACGGAGVQVTAGLAQTGNGIRLVDTSGGGDQLRVGRANSSPAIDGLGFSELGTAGTELVSEDRHKVEPESVFTALMDLHEALVTAGEGQELKITLAGEKIRNYIDEVNRVHGTVGSRSRGMGTKLALTEDAVLSTKALLSEVKDLDYTEAITKFQQSQMTLQANLMTGSKLMQISLMDFI
jgi:flagellar hook-associated protein 3 FlgL